MVKRIPVPLQATAVAAHGGAAAGVETKGGAMAPILVPAAVALILHLQMERTRRAALVIPGVLCIVFCRKAGEGTSTGCSPRYVDSVQ